MTETRHSEQGHQAPELAPERPVVVTAQLREPWAPALARALIAAAIGAIITVFYSQYQKNRDDLNQQFEARKDVIHALSNFIFDRRERSVLLAFAIRSDANDEDIRYRKRQYDESYVDWNKNMTSNLVRMKSIVPHEAYQLVSGYYSVHIDRLFGVADDCITRAYNTHFGEDGKVRDVATTEPVTYDVAYRSREIINTCGTFPVLKVINACGQQTIWSINDLARQSLDQQRQTHLNPFTLGFWDLSFFHGPAREHDLATVPAQQAATGPDTAAGAIPPEIIATERGKLEKVCAFDLP